MMIKENEYSFKDNSKLVFYQIKISDVNEKMVLSGSGWN